MYVSEKMFHDGESDQIFLDSTCVTVQNLAARSDTCVSDVKDVGVQMDLSGVLPPRVESSETFSTKCRYPLYIDDTVEGIVE